MIKNIVLCADDYGQAPAISQAIVALIQHGRLTATSCMVNSLYWPAHANWLAPLRDKADIGLHFNLTEGKPLSKQYIQAHGECFMPLSKLLQRAFMRRLNGAAIEAECLAQLDAFKLAMNTDPIFIDGHQHVHQFPVIREAVMRAYEARLRPKQAYVRWVNEAISPFDIIKDPKKVIIHLTGTKALKKLLDAKNIPHNQSFTGIYAFANADAYPMLFPQFLAKIGHQGIIMCHPGLVTADEGDSIAEARVKEYQYLAGPQFLLDCEAQQVVLNRFH